MVPSDPDELAKAIDAALSRTRDRVWKDRTSVANDRVLDQATREAGLSALDSILRSADEVQKALADPSGRPPEPRSQT
jgi:hypothetical protein